MDGDLDDFISAYLRTSVDGRKSKVDQNLVDDDQRLDREVLTGIRLDENYLFYFV